MGYQFFLPMVLRWRASRAEAPLWIKNEELPVDHTFWWPILRKKFHEIFTLVWEAVSKTRASGFIRGSKHLETIKAIGRRGLVLSSVSRCLEPLIKPSHSLLIYYEKIDFNCFKRGCRNISRIANQWRKIEIFFISLKHPFLWTSFEKNILKFQRSFFRTKCKKVWKFVKIAVFSLPKRLNRHATLKRCWQR